ncbi:hypothetical protein MA03_03115 [Infirmifilum uzonense]|uniref:Amine oxidase domain-containing protein n=1 Tax=Infirmifilum uzonense TaxID=1550241 RepID=A0A0F7FH03_9CREN|nr:FAD-dependent oxidoreductase [Infirmifilum uzonense]AKG38470.1 hypothetical protein MA03_03115 [Infirmifilum uzonense]
MTILKSDIAVLGCGWTGILLSLMLKERYPKASVVCLDASRHPGGLLRTETIDGYTFDIGGSHIIFSRDSDALNQLLGFLDGNTVSHERKSFILYRGVKVPYPFENGLFALPPDIRAELLVGFVEKLLKNNSSPPKPKNLREWAYGFFGEPIAEEYLIPYNEKIWKRRAEEIDSDWLYTPGRLPWPDWRDVVRSGAGVPTTGYREQATFYYPREGGIQSLYEAVYQRASRLGVQVLKGVKVESLERREHWRINGTVEAGHVFSTIPLRELVLALNAPSDVRRACNRLDYNKVLVVGVAMKKPAPNEHWVYVPSRDLVFHRYAWISNYSPKNAPKGASALIAEVTLEPRASVNPEAVEEAVVDGLKEIGVLSESGAELVFAKSWLHEYGYPVYTLGHAEARRTVLEYLEGVGVKTVGRWGSWHYWNMDKVLIEVNRLVSSLPSSP